MAYVISSARALKAWRKGRGLTLREAGELTGYTWNGFWKMENGRTPISPQVKACVVAIEKEGTAGKTVPSGKEILKRSMAKESGESKLQRIEDQDGWRWYERDGKRYLSVTKVLDCIQHEKLQNWWKTKGPAAIKKTTETALVRGSGLHEALETFIKTQAVAPEHEAFIQAFTAFGAEEGLAITESEVMVYSDTLGVAGTIDLVGLLKGEKAVLDLKTGRTYGVKTGYQLAVYRYGLEEMRGEEGYRMAGIHAQDSFRLFAYQHDLFCLQRFLCALECFKGLYFSKLAKLEWPWLHEYTAGLRFRGCDGS